MKVHFKFTKLAKTKKMSMRPSTERYGEQIPFAEPYWYQGFHSPYYSSTHEKFRDGLREWLNENVRPNLEDWIEEKRYPPSLHEKFYQAGFNGCIFPREFGGTPPENFDAFHELILWYELAQLGGGGVLGQLAINSMALPPVIKFGSQRMKDEVVREVVTGKKNICLAISEPGAGSDVANIQTTAVRKRNAAGEKVWSISGTKKWITGGLMANWFTMAVRTGGEGSKGLSLILVPAGLPGIRIRKMPTHFDNSHNTTFILLEDVEVPIENLIGKEGQGFPYIMINFNHERFVIASGALGMSRLTYSLSMNEALQRKTFGKRLVEHQVIRAKLGEMARLIESLQDNTERCAYQFVRGVPDRDLGGQCALLKVMASKTFEYCAREAAQIFGGSSLVREGRGMAVERLYREVRGTAIPGGSEEILLDLAIKQAVRYGLSHM